MTPEHIMPEDHGEQRPETPSGERPEKRPQRNQSRTRGEKPQRQRSRPPEEPVPDEVNEIDQPQPSAEPVIESENQLSINVPDEAPSEEAEREEETPQFRTGDAKWNNKDQEIDIEITGFAGKGNDGRDYVKVKDSETGIPLDEVIWPDEEEMQKLLATHPYLQQMYDDENKRQEVEAHLKTLISPTSDPENIVKAASALNISGDDLIGLLKARGQDRTTISKVEALKYRMPPKEDLGTDDLEQEDKEKVEELQALTKQAKAAGTTEEKLDVRNKLQNWMDENPGFLNKAGRIGRKGIFALMLLGIAYLALLSAVTSGAARRSK